MKYYIVAVFDKESYQTILPIQKNMAKRFRTNRNSPEPFIPLVYIENVNLDKIYPIVEKLISPYKTFNINATNFVYTFEQSKSVNLKLDDKGYIKTISRNLIDTLALHGFNIKPFNEHFISLGNIPYIPKEVKKQNTKINYPGLYDENNLLKLKIKSIEIWKIPTSKKNTPLMEYSLRTV